MTKNQSFSEKAAMPTPDELRHVVKEAEKNEAFSKGVWPGPHHAEGAQTFMMFDPKKRMVHVVWDNKKIIKH